MIVTRTVEHTRRTLRPWPAVALVPTMGALHVGHLSLVKRAGELCPHVAVSIFVNPTQFGPGEDFTHYPRPIERDLEVCESAGVDLVFTPEVNEMYPAGEPETHVDVPAMTQILEGVHRPGHFAGVCRMVAKLFSIFNPTVACFGEKDFQQLAVIRAMAKGLCMGVAIEPCPTVREPDGLALSSRNVYLDPTDRGSAVGLYQALSRAKAMVERGETHPQAVEAAMTETLLAHRLSLDYAVVRDTETLGPVQAITPGRSPVVCLLAAKLGRVRLIDNLVIGR